MATRSNISVDTNGTVSTIYCHFDGYHEGVGATLLEHYQEPAKIRAMMTLGDMSSLGKFVSPGATESHSFDNPLPDVCVFYGRDRGEDGVDMRIYSSPREAYEHEGQYFHYIYRKGEWYVMTQRDSGRIDYKPLSKILK